jgi:hypothetical protein
MAAFLRMGSVGRVFVVRAAAAADEDDDDYNDDDAPSPLRRSINEDDASVRKNDGRKK